MLKKCCSAKWHSKWPVLDPVTRFSRWVRYCLVRSRPVHGVYCEGAGKLCRRGILASIRACKMWGCDLFALWVNKRLFFGCEVHMMRTLGQQSFWKRPMWRHSGFFCRSWAAAVVKHTWLSSEITSQGWPPQIRRHLRWAEITRI